MKSARLAGSVLLLLSVAVPAWGAGDSRIENLALCRESWLDWQTNDPSEFENFKLMLESAFSSGRDDGSLAHRDFGEIGLPKQKCQVARKT